MEVESKRTKQRQYAYWLCSLPGIGNRTIDRLLKACGGTPESVYHSSRDVWKRVLGEKQFEHMEALTTNWKLEEAYGKLKTMGIQFLLREDGEYPKRLQSIPDSPYGLFCKGKLPKEERLSVAMIGARDCSPYGSYVAEELGKYLGAQNVQIISGMARGIDGISQEAAMSAGGVSFGVLGCGVDICYPAQNRRLYEKLLENGGVLSSYPPGTMPRSQNFPPRNRIVSGLADVVVVIEARNKSGTLITVDMALEQGKDVYVVPGRITDRLSDGCNGLIKQGAGVVISPKDFYEEIMASWEERRAMGERNGNRATEVEHTQKMFRRIDMTGLEDAKEVNAELKPIYQVLERTPQSLEEIVARLPDSYHFVQVNTMLLRLCMEDAAVQLSPGYFCRK